MTILGLIGRVLLIFRPGAKNVATFFPHLSHIDLPVPFWVVLDRALKVTTFEACFIPFWALSRLVFGDPLRPRIRPQYGFLYRTPLP